MWRIDWSGGRLDNGVLTSNVVGRGLTDDVCKHDFDEIMVTKI